MTITHTVVNPGMFEHWGDMNEDFLVFLDSVFQGCGWFTKITSDYRDPIAQQEQIKEGHGAAEYSLHELGKAIDLRAPRQSDGKLDYVKYGLLVDAVCLYRRGIKVELELDITPNNVHIHIGWYGTPGGLIVEPVCRHTIAA